MEGFACESCGALLRDYQQVVLAERGSGGIFLWTASSFLGYC